MGKLRTQLGITEGYVARLSEERDAVHLTAEQRLDRINELLTRLRRREGLEGGGG